MKCTVLTSCAGTTFSYCVGQELTVGEDISEEVADDLLRAGFIAEQKSRPRPTSTKSTATDTTSTETVERTSTNRKTKHNTAKVFGAERG